MTQKNYPQAENIWKNYLANSEQSIGFKGISAQALEQNDLELLQKLKGLLEQKDTSSARAIGIVYGAIIKVLGKYRPDLLVVSFHTVSVFDLTNFCSV